MNQRMSATLPIPEEAEDDSDLTELPVEPDLGPGGIPDDPEFDRVVNAPD